MSMPRVTHAATYSHAQPTSFIPHRLFGGTCSWLRAKVLLAILTLYAFSPYISHFTIVGAQELIVSSKDVSNGPAGVESSNSGEQKPTQQSRTALKTVAASVEPFTVSVTLDAVLDTRDYQPVILRSLALKDLKLESFAQHGQWVAKGQQVLKLDGDSWHRAFSAAQQALASAELELHQARKQAETINETIRLELASSEMTAKQAAEDYEYFQQQGRDQQAEAQEQSLKSAERALENAREEYEQLKKMYKADQITEETEEIVLRRAKFDVERAEYGLRVTESRVRRFMDVELNRQEKNLKNAVERSQLDLQRLQMGMEQRVQSARLQVARAETSAEMARREMTKLKEDQQLLEISAKFPGAVFWGAVERGQWKGSAGVEELMFEGSNVPANRPLMTILGTEKLQVHCKVPERWSRLIPSGIAGELELTAAGGKRVSVNCEQVGSLPSEPGHYRAVFKFSRKAEARELNPLMTGKVTLVLYNKENALILPLEAVRRDSSGEFVMLAPEDEGHPIRQAITIGWRDETKAEVIQGIREGENVLLP